VNGDFLVSPDAERPKPNVIKRFSLMTDGPAGNKARVTVGEGLV